MTRPLPVRFWASTLMLGVVLVALLRSGPWNPVTALAFGAALAGVVAIVGRRGVAAHPDGDAALEALTARLRAAAAGDFGPASDGVPGAVPPDQRAVIDTAFHQLRRTVERANTLAYNDPVTNLPNRLHFRRDGEARLAGLPDDTPSALLFVDLDRFKAVNDTLGHAHGDMLLMHIARRLREQVDAHVASAPDRPAPLIGRLAGDEFIVLLPGRDRSDALALARQFLWSLRSPLTVGSRPVTIGASIGVAVAPDHGTTVGELMRGADDAMYAAKDAGRGRVCLFEGSMAARRLKAERLEAELGGALASGDFQLVYQPQIELSSGRTSVVEALLRWGPEGRPPVAAADFLAVAEESGLIGPIGEWVADAIAARLSEWQRAGYRGRLAVNLSPRQLAQADTLARLESAVTSAGGRLAGLEVEIGETAVARAAPDALAALGALRSRGVTVTVDDYGSGQSRLRDLADWPVDRVKLDGSLVRDLPHSAAARAIAAAAVDLIRNLGREAVAAGVETPEQLHVLRQMGVEAAQGYHFARPMSAAELAHWTYAGEESAAIAMAL